MYQELLSTCEKYNATLIAVSKTKPVEAIQSIYDLGQRDFGENRVQELREKYNQLPKDIRWHIIGHLQKNKVKYIAPYVYMIHSVDSSDLLATINKAAAKHERIINVLLQVKIAQEDTKYGLSQDDALSILAQYVDGAYPNVAIKGLMGMATFTHDESAVQGEFASLASLRDQWSDQHSIELPDLSMGMSGDYQIALDAGSTMIRVGSLIFGSRG